MGIGFKQINIFSDIMPYFADDFSCLVRGDSLPKRGKSDIIVVNIADTTVLRQSDVASQDSLTIADSLGLIIPNLSDSIIYDTKIHDYSEGGKMKQRLIRALLNAEKQPMHIAVIGDSFIEGDIMVMDLRTLLQKRFSGAGVGFVPITSPASRYRITVEHKHSNDWSVDKINTKPTEGKYLLSGTIFSPAEGSWVEYKTKTSFKKYSNTTTKAQLLFINRDSVEIKVILNDSNDTITYHPESSDRLQAITINQPIEKIKYLFHNVKGASLYGAILESDTAGVGVDNYSLRGNSGLTMSHISPELSREYSAIRDYDLIIIEYGLNIVNPKVKDYKDYDKRFINIINHIKSCYPETPILLMSVAERSTLNQGKAEIMDGLTEFNQQQQLAAIGSKVLFWNTLQVMQNLGGMSKFTEKGWAAKDYTHLTASGGEIIATELFKAMTDFNLADFIPADTTTLESIETIEQ